MKFFKIITQTFLFLLLLVFSYFAISYLIQLIPSSQKCQKNGDYFYVYHADVHTEIILEINKHKDLLLQKFPHLLRGRTKGYISFSYGDKDFMMKVPDWDHINFQLALNALFINTQGVLRVGYYSGVYLDKVTKVDISNSCKKKLLEIILDTFKSKNNKFMRIEDDLHDNNTFYFLAKKPYNLLHTCNSWSGDILRKSGLSMGYWTPLADQVGYHIKE